MDLQTNCFLRTAIEIGALEILPEGRQLKSGRISPYFFNSGLFTKGSALADLLGAYMIAWQNHPLLREEEVDVVYGPAYKGISLASGLAILCCRHWDMDIEYAHDRKEAKDHGEGGRLVGARLQGKRVLIVDDVMTSGLSSAEAVDIVRDYGGIPVGAVIAFDRQEIGKDSQYSAVEEFEQKFQIPVAAAATLEDLLVYLRSIEHSIVPAIEEYKRHYGIFRE